METSFFDVFESVSDWTGSLKQCPTRGTSKGEKAVRATVSTSAWKWKSIAARGAFCSGLIRVKEREGERGRPRASMCMHGGRHSCNSLCASLEADLNRLAEDLLT